MYSLSTTKSSEAVSRFQTPFTASISTFGLWLALAFGFVLSLVACSPYGPNLGETPFRCGSEEPRCPSGYDCQSVPGDGDLCFQSGSVDAAQTTLNKNFTCNDDSIVEPNETIALPFSTNIPGNQTQVELTGLAICPGTDVDIFSVGVDSASIGTLQTKIVHNTDFGKLQLFVLDSEGQRISTATIAVGDPSTLQTIVTDLEPGQYFIEVRSATASRNNYRLSVDLL